VTVSTSLTVAPFFCPKFLRGIEVEDEGSLCSVVEEFLGEAEMRSAVVSSFRLTL